MVDILRAESDRLRLASWHERQRKSKQPWTQLAALAETAHSTTTNRSARSGCSCTDDSVPTNSQNH